MVFRIEPVHRSQTLRVLHGEGEQRALAVITPEDDGSVCLFPIKFNNLPLPLTGASQNFPDVAAVAAYLGLSEEEIAA